MKVNKYSLIFCISTAFVSSISYADFVAKVVGITDGDTMIVLTNDRKTVKIRLANIDAPEKSQPFGNKAKQALSDLAYNKFVYIKEHGFDQYGRTIGTVMLGNDPVNRIMVRNGLAWSYRQYNTDPIINNLEVYARQNKIGLWHDAKPIAPSEWRKMQREQ